MDFNEREMLIGILQKRQIDERRNEILQNAKLAKADFKSGKIKANSSINVIKKLSLK